MTIIDASPDVGFGKDWWRSLTKLDGSDARRVSKAMDQFLSDPLHPSLKMHPIEGDSTRRLHTIRASQDLRILLAKEGNVHVFLEAGQHDDIYERARRSRFVVNPHAGHVGLIDIVSATAGWDPGDSAAPGVPVQPGGSRRRWATPVRPLARSRTG